MPPRPRQFVLWVALAATSVAAPGAGSRFDPERFPARDSHQGVTIAARPVADTPEAEAIFGKNAAPTRAGVLPVELIVANERPQAVRVALERIVIVTDNAKFEQVSPEEIAWALYPPPKTKRPIDSTRLPSRLPRDKKRLRREEAEAALRRAALRAAVVPAGGAARGFRYFALGEKPLNLAVSRVYIPEVERVPTGERLLYFEISLKPYAEPKP